MRWLCDNTEQSAKRVIEKMTKAKEIGKKRLIKRNNNSIH